MNEQLKEIALQIGQELWPGRSGEYELMVIERFLAALPIQSAPASEQKLAGVKVVMRQQKQSAPKSGGNTCERTRL